ncbi:MAG: PAS/PAC sensor signal transduction histidine [Geobacteraceae bacterium]|nr:MAG: PAS/PAC sensor signal transduction histidine [Geobacteraceae bacterium]
MFGNDTRLKARLRKKEQQLKACESRFHSIITKSSDGIVIVDRNGIVRSLNPAAENLFGVKRDELMGKPFGFRIITGETIDIDIITKTGKTVVAEMRAMETVWNGKATSYVFLRDITARKRVEEEIEILNTNLAARAAELETANRELEAFSYTVSHDLRAPLTNINGYCQIMLHVCADRLDDECRGFMQRVFDEAQRMDHLINTLLNFSRLTRCEMHSKTFCLSETAQAVAAELRQKGHERRVTFTIAEGVEVDGDARLLRVVLDNLLSNAWKYTGKQESACIEFGVTESGGKPTYFVRDNGAGFDMRYADRLFCPFQRLHSKEEFEGHGIGLATVQRIIQRHGGRVWAEGEMGKGATFYFTL